MGLILSRAPGLQTPVAMIRQIIVFVACLLWLSWGSARPQVVFLDVGQGDAAILVGDGVTGLVDAGPAWGQSSLAGEIFLQLTGMGVTELDWVGLSHGDRDHWGGIPDLLQRIPVGAVFLHPGVVPKVPRVLSSALESNTRTLPVPRGHWSPGAQGSYRWYTIDGSRSNDRGLVLLWEYQGCRFLFLGDLEATGEALFLEQFQGTVDVLKVSHHGSRTSSGRELLSRLRPRWGIVSSGVNNPYGHPHAVVLSRLRDTQIDILRTDFHGFIRFTFENGVLQCDTAEGSCGTGVCGANRT